MTVTMLKSKIHRATVTFSEKDYVGSITVDPVLLEAAGILPYEKVLVSNVTNANRFETYAIEGKRGSGEVGTNGAAAHLAKKGDLVIIFAWASMTPEEAKSHHPRIVIVGEGNAVAEVR